MHHLLAAVGRLHVREPVAEHATGRAAARAPRGAASCATPVLRSTRLDPAVDVEHEQVAGERRAADRAGDRPGVRREARSARAARRTAPAPARQATACRTPRRRWRPGASIRRSRRATTTTAPSIHAVRAPPTAGWLPERRLHARPGSRSSPAPPGRCSASVGAGDARVGEADRRRRVTAALRGRREQRGGAERRARRASTIRSERRIRGRSAIAACSAAAAERGERDRRAARGRRRRRAPIATPSAGRRARRDPGQRPHREASG